MMRRILIVDDEVSLRASLARYLVGRGYEVVQAGSGEEAVRALQREKIACVLLDIGLPDQSGIDLVPGLLTLEPMLAILMLTGVADVSTAALCMQRGAFDYLAKPIELTELDGAIGRAMERRERLLGDHRSIALLKDEVARLVIEVHRQQTRFEKPLGGHPRVSGLPAGGKKLVSRRSLGPGGASGGFAGRSARTER
jgi:DNA-binding NtrC family response regulator